MRRESTSDGVRSIETFANPAAHIIHQDRIPGHHRLRYQHILGCTGYLGGPRVQQRSD